MLALLRQQCLACQHLVLVHVRTLTVVTEPVSSGLVSKASTQGCILTLKEDSTVFFLKSLADPDGLYYNQLREQGQESEGVIVYKQTNSFSHFTS